MLTIVTVYGMRAAWCLLSYRLRRRDRTWCTRAAIFGNGLNVFLEDRPGVLLVPTIDLGLIECVVRTDDGRTVTVWAFQPGGTPSVVEAQPMLSIARSYDIRWYASWHGHRYDVCRGTFAVHPGVALATLAEPEGHVCFAKAGPLGR